MDKQIFSIFETLQVGIHPEQRRRLAVIDLEDFSGVERKVREHFVELGRELSAGYVERGIYALKQYYAVALLDPANAHAVSRVIDPFWHAHILHTEQYMEFCNRVVGEYMHHQPLDHARPDHVAIIRRLYGYTLEVLTRFFSVVSPEFWPNKVMDAELICMHKGNQTIYSLVQEYRLLEPSFRGTGSLRA